MKLPHKDQNLSGAKENILSCSFGSGGDLFCSSDCSFNFVFPSFFHVAGSKRGGTEVACRLEVLWEWEALANSPCPDVEVLLPWICLFFHCFWKCRTLGMNSEFVSITVFSKLAPQTSANPQTPPPTCKFSGPTPYVLNQNLCGWSLVINPCWKQALRVLLVQG